MGRETGRDRADKNGMSRDKADREERDREASGKKYGFRAGLCAFLLMLLWLIASDTYQILPGFYEKVIRVGVFSDSYWEVQNGYSYQILEDAIDEFEKQHPGIRVEYVSGIIREDYSEWLSEQMMRGTTPDIFFVLSHDEVVHLKCSMLNKMPGLGFDKFANLKAGYAFMMGHAGKKLLFMGQEFAQLREWSEERELDWFLLAEEEHQAVQNWMRDLLHLYKKNPALYQDEQIWEGFEWINADDAYRSIFSFVRHSKNKKKNLLFVINFTPMTWEDYRVGVPRKKQYKLIMNSDDGKYGGTGKERPVVYKAVKKECDGRPFSFAYELPPYGVAVFEF